MYSNPNISASSWPKLKIKDSFEILRTGRFQNCPYFLDAIASLATGHDCESQNAKANKFNKVNEVNDLKSPMKKSIEKSIEEVN